MKLGIIAAMNEELKPLLNEMSLEKTETIANITFNEGILNGKKIIAAVCGIGKVNAAICTQIICSIYKPDKIINVGVAGGISKNIYPGDIVIASNLVEHDMDCSVFGDALGQVPRMDTFDFKCDENLVKLAENVCNSISKINSFTGRIVSGDQFVSNIEKVQYLEKQFSALSCEMEGASIAHVCYSNKIPFVVIRSISDNANNGAHIDFEKFTPIAVEHSTFIIKKMLLKM